jgi:hypothetical protein
VPSYPFTLSNQHLSRTVPIEATLGYWFDRASFALTTVEQAAGSLEGTEGGEPRYPRFQGVRLIIKVIFHPMDAVMLKFDPTILPFSQILSELDAKTPAFAR